MKALLAATAILLAANSLPALSAQPVPCEQRIEELSTAVKTAKLSAAQSTQIAELRQKAIDQCKHEKDAEADTTIDAAMKVLGK